MSTNPYNSPSIGPDDAAETAPRGLEDGFRDQSTGLVLFGLLQLAMAAFCGLAAVMIVGVLLVAGGAAGNPGMTWQTMLPGVATYGTV